VARPYNRIAGFHCGHGPSAAPGERPSEVEGGIAVEFRSIDRLTTASRASVLARLRAVGAAEEVSESAAVDALRAVEAAL
jgi:hypothetical protein